jgi:hypothetical protein
VIIPIIAALLTTLVISTVNVFSRYFPLKSKITSGQYIADSLLMVSIMLFIMFLCFPRYYSLETFFFVGGISTLNSIGLWCINEAIFNGKAGPAQVCVEFQSLWLLFLEMTILSKYPNTL